jgi:Fe-S-cluster containining protein
MGPLVQIEKDDCRLLAAIGNAMAESTRRSGEWLACRPGCTQCCLGPFAITQLDAHRLRQGLQVLATVDPARAAAVRLRAESYIRTAAPVYPGDPVSGALWDQDSLPAFLDEIPCPVLDPVTGWCDLYAARPITCRAFGPITRTGEEILGPCDLCYADATEQEMLECAVEIDPAGIEDSLLAALAAEGISGMTIVAYALAARQIASVHGANGQEGISR